MNIRFLETFVWVARLGSFRAAASKLHLTQAAVSGRMTALETDLQHPLFQRHGRHMRLNQAGQTLLHHAEQILHLEQRLRTELEGPTILRGRVRLGVIETIISTWFPHLLQQLQQQHPQVEIELTVESNRRLHDLLKGGLIDVALHTDPVLEQSIRNIPLGKLPMGWVFNQSHRNNLPIDLDELLSNWTIVTFPRHSQPHLLLLELLENQPKQHTPRIHFVSSIAACTQLVQTGRCAAAMPTAIFKPQIEKNQCIVVPHLPSLGDMQLVASWRPEPTLGLVTAIVKGSIEQMKNYAALHEDVVASDELPIFTL